MAKYIPLTAQQKDEIRRLTQLANRRIRSAQKVYEKEGKIVLPREIVGHYQLKEDWTTSKTPISRSVKFTSHKEYRQQLQFLRSFEVTRPTITQYTEIQREKVALATVNVLNEQLSYGQIHERLANMTAPQLAEFWNTFSANASRAGMSYSSEAVMEQTFAELFPEDLVNIIPKR